MGHALALVLILSGCAITANYGPEGRITDVTLSAGLATPTVPENGGQSVKGIGLAYTGHAAVIGYFAVNTAHIGPCGLAVVTDHPERIDPALYNPC